jgi:hypothetical protein
MKQLKYLLLGLIVIIQSCDLTDDPEITGTPVQSMAGEWYLQLYDLADGTLYVDYSLCTTSNTSANVSDKMWFLDHDHFWSMQTLMNVNTANQTFSGDNVNIFFDGAHTTPAGKPVVALGTVKNANSAVPARIRITDGKILENAAHVPSRTEADSMYCQMTGVYQVYRYIADSYTINGTDTVVVWRLADSAGTSDDGPYGIAGYRRTGFLEDEH